LAKKEQVANIKEGTTLMRIYNEGKVTVGKDRYKDVFELDIDGNIRANSLYLDTDRSKMEEDSICEIGGVLDKVCDLKPIRFKWNNKTKGVEEPERIGLIADEVKPFFPEVVKENAACNGDTVAYQNLVPVLIKAIQEQQALILAQAETLKELKCKVEELEDRICKLEND
jgi:polyhydroxyalkanoate synthesis regulator phasin